LTGAPISNFDIFLSVALFVKVLKKGHLKSMDLSAVFSVGRLISTGRLAKLILDFSRCSIRILLIA
jgi:hypothetical protein